ncbi:MAG: DUF4091 domain-containing protein [Candidatus Aureabacteria bacterium]|nr:DUF4091 domain-containing protein [Candidatus Auribacterota bacterium]
MRGLRVVPMVVAASAIGAGAYHAIVWHGQSRVYFEGAEFPARVEAGVQFPISVIIRPCDEIHEDLRLFIHFVDPRGGGPVNADVTLPIELRRWTVGRQLRLGPFRCVIPSGCAGRYEVRAGIFYPRRGRSGGEQLVRVPFRNRGRFNWKIGEIQVSRPAPRIYPPEPFLEGGYAIGYAGPLDAVFPEKNAFRGPCVDKVRVRLARNESESFQCVLIPGDAPLGPIAIEWEGLAHGGGGSPLGKECVTVRRVGYVRTRAPYYNVSRAGLWPDPLLPRTGTDAAIPEDRVQPFWVTVHIPEAAEDGEYEGAIVVRPSGRPGRRLRLLVTVWDFSLPRRATLKTGFDFYEHIMKEYYPRRAGEPVSTWQGRLRETCRRYYLDLIDHRLWPIHNVGNPLLAGARDGEYRLDFRDFGAQVDFYTGAGQGDFGIAMEAPTIDPDRGVWSDEWYGFTGPKAVRGVFRTFGRCLEERGWLGRAYTYIIDERYEGVRTLTRLIHEGHPGVRNLLTQTPRDGYPDVDIWCIRINNFDPAVAREFQRRGDEIWIYVASPTRPFPGIAIDAPSLDIRVLPWICRRYDITGFLYWCVNYWSRSDPWKDPMTWPDQNGNGSLFYPGEEGPVDSIRLEVLRDGMEDYEYLRLAGERWGEERLQEGIATVARSTWEYADSPEALTGLRDRIGEALDGSGRRAK